MKELKIEFQLKELALNELTDSEYQLMQTAISAAENAYAPYSCFQVGAAVLLQNGVIITGNNQENAAYPSGLCAERVALFYAGAQYPQTAATTLAVVALKDGIIQPNISPCGACRQVLMESEQRGNTPMTILLCEKEKVLKISSASALLPLAFTEKNL
ncbi:cytidine deaminase [Parabacteroides sp. PF5-9]|uniref:cytidine deaminase n=1 Tax=Parabacteroides sp. PF5-9 TaxID=1742404 RepID=UPI00247497B5|nr:cytidine deaminase [Parabacteroides sp. PF5-9]MDH6358163.1 cytidine deaminase [Parabacteroides sp. PF5-9]